MKIPILCRQRAIERGENLGTVVLVLVLLAIAENCWMIVRDTGMEKEDEEEYLKRWMEITV